METGLFTKGDAMNKVAATKQAAAKAKRIQGATEVIDRREWFNSGARHLAIQGLASVWAAEEQLNVPAGQPGNVDQEIAALARKLGMRPGLLHSIVLQGVIDISQPRDSFHFEMLAD